MALLPLSQYIRVAGPFGVSGFALTAAAGAVAGRGVLQALLRGGSPLRAEVLEVLLPLLLGALVGGRLGNQVVLPDLNWRQPLTWLSASGTSLSYAGALIGAGVAVWWSLGARPLRHRLQVLDLLAPAAAAGIAIGWLGVPALGHASAAFHPPLYGGVGVQPVQLYGAVGFAAIAAWLWRQASVLDFPGQNLATFVALMSAFRFVLGFLVPGPVVFGPWSAAQVADAVLALVGLVGGLLLQRLDQPGAAVGGEAR